MFHELNSILFLQVLCDVQIIKYEIESYSNIIIMKEIQTILGNTVENDEQLIFQHSHKKNSFHLITFSNKNVLYLT